MDYFKAFMNTHVLFVTLFLIHYVIKLVFLLTNKNDILAKYTRVTKVPEMILSFGFLVTGIWLLANGGVFNTFMIIKLVCVFASIPLAIIGFKKANKGLALIAVVLIVASYGLAEVSVKQVAGKRTDSEDGHEVYNARCVQCHGADGRLGTMGARDLTTSPLTADQKKAFIRTGKGAMPPFGKAELSDAQLDAVVQYIEGLPK